MPPDTAISEPTRIGDLIKYEAPQRYSREQETVLNGQTLELGAVVGKVTATDKLVELAPAASDGSEVAYGVLVEDAAPSGADGQAVVIRRHAMLADNKVVWPAGITGPQVTAALAQLEAKGIILRTEA